MSQKEILKRLAKILTNQQQIIMKLAQMPAPTQTPNLVEESEEPGEPGVEETLEVSPEKGSIYMDPDSDIYSDLSEAVRALTGEQAEMGDADDE